VTTGIATRPGLNAVTAAVSASRHTHTSMQHSGFRQSDRLPPGKSGGPLPHPLALHRARPGRSERGAACGACARGRASQAPLCSCQGTEPQVEEGAAAAVRKPGVEHVRGGSGVPVQRPRRVGYEAHGLTRGQALRLPMGAEEGKERWARVSRCCSQVWWDSAPHPERGWRSRQPEHFTPLPQSGAG